jgi:hypothetical protein
MPASHDIPADATLAVVGDPVFTDIPGETVILDARSGRYFGLDEVGSFVWRHLQASTTLRDLVTLVTGAYDVADEDCERDLRLLLHDLRAAGLIAVDERARD